MAPSRAERNGRENEPEINRRQKSQKDILKVLTVTGSASADELAVLIGGITPGSIRNSILRLHDAGLVIRTETKQTRGRPAYRYSLSPKAYEQTIESMAPETADILFPVEEVLEAALSEIELQHAILDRNAERIRSMLALIRGEYIDVPTVTD